MASETREYDERWGPHTADRAVSALAGRQHGVISIAQLLRLGLTKDGIRRRVESGFLHRLWRGVYAVGHLALTPRSRELAAVFACGPSALLSHRSAGRLWGVLKSSSPRIEVTAARGIKPKEGITVRVSRVLDHDADRALIDGIPVTGLARTLVDLAEVLDDPRLSDAINEAEILQLFDLTALEAAIARIPGRRGRHRLRRVLASYRPEPRLLRNDRERRLLSICRRHGLPEPDSNVVVLGREVDLLWPGAGLVVEYDGAATHNTRRAFHADRRRDRALAAAGFHVVRVTWPDISGDGSALTAELRSILAARSAPHAVAL